METFILRKMPEQDGAKITAILQAIKNQFPETIVEQAVIVETDVTEIADFIRLLGGRSIGALPVEVAATAAIFGEKKRSYRKTTKENTFGREYPNKKMMTCSQCGNERLWTRSGICKPCIMINAKHEKKNLPAGVDVIVEDESTDQHFITRHGPILGKKLG